MKTIYQTKATATGGRNGHVETEDGILNLEVRMPTSMGGQGKPYTNPEQLFAAGYSACFDSALNHVARMQKQRITSTVSAHVSLVMHSETDLRIDVQLDVHIEGVEREKAEELLALAHQTCPYSKATRNNVDVKLNLV